MNGLAKYIIAVVDFLSIFSDGYSSTGKMIY